MISSRRECADGRYAPHDRIDHPDVRKRYLDVIDGGYLVLL